MLNSLNITCRSLWANSASNFIRFSSSKTLGFTVTRLPGAGVTFYSASVLIGYNFLMFLEGRFYGSSKDSLLLSFWIFLGNDAHLYEDGVVYLGIIIGSFEMGDSFDELPVRGELERMGRRF